MDDVTQQNAALVEQAAASAESLEEQTENLMANLAKFKVDENFLKPSTIRPVASVQKPAMPVKLETYRSKNATAQVSQSRVGSADEWEEF